MARAETNSPPVPGDKEGWHVLTFMWFVLVAMMVALCAACDLGQKNRVPGCVSWFVILPQMQEPTKKAKGRMQQKRKKRR